MIERQPLLWEDQREIGIHLSRQAEVEKIPGNIPGTAEGCVETKWELYGGRGLHCLLKSSLIFWGAWDMSNCVFVAEKNLNTRQYGTY